MKVLRRSLFLVWMFTFVSVAFAQPSLKVQNGSQQVAVSFASLKSLPHKTVTIHGPHTNQDEAWSGVPLIELLKQVGAPTGHDVRGKALSQYIVARVRTDTRRCWRWPKWSRIFIPAI